MLAVNKISLTIFTQYFHDRCKENAKKGKLLNHLSDAVIKERMKMFLFCESFLYSPKFS